MERVELLWTRGLETRDAEPGTPYVLLGGLTGFAEQAVTGVSTLSALALLDVLLTAPDGGGQGFAASRLAAPDRDRLLARVYVRSFGPRVESTLECSGCGEPFDLDFDLAELLESLEAPASESGGGEEDASVVVLEGGAEGSPAGVRFRLPTGEDELAVAGLPPEAAEAELARRCRLDGREADGSGETESAEGFLTALDEHLARTAPLVDCELDAPCPECGTPHSVRFDVQHYLLTLLTAERPRLANEIHRLAAAYGWSLSEILSLPRDDRRALVERVEADLAARARAVP